MRRPGGGGGGGGHLEQEAIPIEFLKVIKLPTSVALWPELHAAVARGRGSQRQPQREDVWRIRKCHIGRVLKHHIHFQYE